MKIRDLHLALLMGALAISTLVGQPVEAGEGFGTFNKDFAVMNRVHPPQVFLTGTRIAVKAAGQSSELQAISERLKTLLESELLSADRRLTIDAIRPETLSRDHRSEQLGHHKVGESNRGHQCRYREQGQ